MTRKASQPADPITISDGRKPAWYWIDDSINLHYALDIKATGIAVYTALVMTAKGRHEFTADLGTLTACAGLENRETTIIAIQRLADAGLISIFRARGRANVYRILHVGAPNPAVVGPRRPKDPLQPVGNSDRLDPNPSEKPTGQPVGISDYSTPNPSEIPNTPVGNSERFAPNQSEIPTLRRDSRRRIYTHQTESHDDDARASSLAPQLQTWEDLIAFYGGATVIAAQHAASNQSKRNDLAYIRGVLRRRARQGQPPTRPDIFAPRPPSPDAADADPLSPDSSDPPDQSAPLSPVETAWATTVANLSLGMSNGSAAMLADVYANIRADTLVIHAPTDYARGWLQNRIGDRILAAWHTAGGAQVSKLVFITEPAVVNGREGEPQ